MGKPNIGIYGLTGCAGDQLTILNCEDELLDIISAVNLKSFIMAQTGNDECELDIAFVDGTVTQERDLILLKEIRERSGLVIAIGTCAVWGGIPAMRNNVSRDVFIENVYGKKNGFLNCVPVLPLNSYIKVDFHITGCPIEKKEILTSITSFLNNDLPILPTYPVCTECKMHEYECRLVKYGELCLGPVTLAGCNARCPGLNISCKGCRGLVAEANIASEISLLKEKDYPDQDIINSLKTFTAPAKIIKRELAEKEN